jgi:hypothetical protein
MSKQKDNVGEKAMAFVALCCERTAESLNLVADLLKGRRSIKIKIDTCKCKSKKEGGEKDESC